MSFALPLLYSGLVFGCHWTLVPAVASELFGLRYFASIYSTMQLFAAAGSYLLATLLAGTLYDRQARCCRGDSCMVSHRCHNGRVHAKSSCVALLSAASSPWYVQHAVGLRDAANISYLRVPSLTHCTACWPRSNAADGWPLAQARAQGVTECIGYACFRDTFRVLAGLAGGSALASLFLWHDSRAAYERIVVHLREVDANVLEL